MGISVGVERGVVVILGTSWNQSDLVTDISVGVSLGTSCQILVLQCAVCYVYK